VDQGRWVVPLSENETIQSSELRNMEVWIGGSQQGNFRDYAYTCDEVVAAQHPDEPLATRFRFPSCGVAVVIMWKENDVDEHLGEAFNNVERGAIIDNERLDFLSDQRKQNCFALVELNANALLRPSMAQCNKRILFLHLSTTTIYTLDVMPPFFCTMEAFICTSSRSLSHRHICRCNILFTIPSNPIQIHDIHSIRIATPCLHRFCVLDVGQCIGSTSAAMCNIVTCMPTRAGFRLAADSTSYARTVVAPTTGFRLDRIM